MSRVKVFITDKDCKEISAIEDVFPDVVLLLCLFHVLQIVNRKLVKVPIHERSLISDAFRTAVFTNSEEEYNRNKSYLCSLGKKSVELSITR